MNWELYLLEKPQTIRDVGLPPPLDAAVFHLSHSNYHQAESVLLASGPDTRTSRLSLLILGELYLRLKQKSRLADLIQELSQLFPYDPFVRYLWVSYCLLISDTKSLSSIESDFWDSSSTSIHFLVAQIQVSLLFREHTKAELLVDRIEPKYMQTSSILRAQLLQAQGKSVNALHILEPHITSSVCSEILWTTYLQLHFDMRRGEKLTTLINQGLSTVPYPESLFHFVSWAFLLKRMPASARRYIFLQRLRNINLRSPIQYAQLATAHEGIGSLHLVNLFPSFVLSAPEKYIDLHSNLVLHRTSLGQLNLQAETSNLIHAIESHPAYPLHTDNLSSLSTAKPRLGKRLKVAWVCGDCRYHPVARFVLGFFHGSTSPLTHDHTIVSTAPSTDGVANLFCDLDNASFLDVSDSIAHHKTQRIRDQQFDVALDLSGWTDHNIAPSFISRLAPIQINYLGYFGTTGIPAMDWWLGDQYLFPPHTLQWHSEKLFRLSRCFLSWTPHPRLPEATAEILAAANGPVRFGCFNHLRKLSDSTLHAWATLLTRNPESRLVLKAAGFEDPPAHTLLRRRLSRCGIQPDRVDYLPFSHSTTDHLAQYQHIDICLDPFPNGGCTTTCEALWMGVPVISLAGNSYVSRMSTSVLRGSNNDDLVTQTIDDYIGRALDLSYDVTQLRQNRFKWRQSILSSDLGDSTSLLSSLEEAFMTMAQTTTTSI